MHHQLQLRVHLQHGERVLVHVRRACLQWARGRRGAVRLEQFVTGTGAVHPDERQRQSQDARVNGGRQFAYVFLGREMQCYADAALALQLACARLAVGHFDLRVSQLPGLAACAEIRSS